MCFGGGGGQTYKSKVSDASRLADKQMLDQIEAGKPITRNKALDDLKFPKQAVSASPQQNY